MSQPHLRASDADRAGVADVLGRAMSSGRLTVAEYDDRLSRAYAARTLGELAELTTDLPAAPAPAPAAPTARPAPQRPVAVPWWAHGWSGNWWGGMAGGGGSSLRAAWASWATTALIVTGIWVLSMVGSADWVYPWPVWVVGPWGAVLLVQTLGGGRERDRQRDRGRTLTH